jgi:hypothetical protein
MNRVHALVDWRHLAGLGLIARGMGTAISTILGPFVLGGEIVSLFLAVPHIAEALAGRGSAA